LCVSTLVAKNCGADSAGLMGPKSSKARENRFDPGRYRSMFICALVFSLEAVYLDRLTHNTLDSSNLITLRSLSACFAKIDIWIFSNV